MNWINRRTHYTMVQWRYNIVSDNGPTDSLISQFVMDWNHHYKSPKMILNTVEKMFEEFEKRYGDQLPVFKGDLTPYWEDGAYSSAAETAMNRRNSEKLTAFGDVILNCRSSKYNEETFDLAGRTYCCGMNIPGAHTTVSQIRTSPL